MNNFNLVLEAIKEHCKEAGNPDVHCLELVKAKLKEKDEDGVDFYLEFLQDLGMIKYNDSKGLIALTERGKHTDSLFD